MFSQAESLVVRFYPSISLKDIFTHLHEISSFANNCKPVTFIVCLVLSGAVLNALYAPSVYQVTPYSHFLNLSF